MACRGLWRCFTQNHPHDELASLAKPNYQSDHACTIMKLMEEALKEERWQSVKVFLVTSGGVA
jgi:hypothetical protein